MYSANETPDKCPLGKGEGEKEGVGSDRGVVIKSYGVSLKGA